MTLILRVEVMPWPVNRGNSLQVVKTYRKGSCNQMVSCLLNVFLQNVFNLPHRRNCQPFSKIDF